MTDRFEGPNQIDARIAQPMEGNEFKNGLIRSWTITSAIGQRRGMKASVPPSVTAISGHARRTDQGIVDDPGNDEEIDHSLRHRQRSRQHEFGHLSRGEPPTDDREGDEALGEGVVPDPPQKAARHRGGPTVAAMRRNQWPRSWECALNPPPF